MTEVPLRTLAGDTPQAAEIIAIVELWRAAFAKSETMAGRGTPEGVSPDAISFAASAAAVLAGTYFGNAIIAGLATDQDKRRASEAFARNFKTGIEIGKRQGLRVAASMPVGGHA